MRFSFWQEGAYPIFINPTDKEITELANSSWDTVRICVENDIIAVASGYGNTHESVVKAVRQTISKRFHPETYILFKESGGFFFNLEDMSGERRVDYRSAIKEYFDEPHQLLLLDLVQQSE